VTVGRVKLPHHRGAHQRLARIVVIAARRDPTTRCQSDACIANHGTLAEHQALLEARRLAGRYVRLLDWHAGHVRPGVRATQVSDYRPEVDVCNERDGALRQASDRRGLRPTRKW
jgi:hypothetical protein